MPSASPAGTQPFMISLAKSCPDRSEVNGRFWRLPRGSPGGHRRDAGGADGRADRLELKAAGRERADGQPDADHAVPAQFLALGRHPVQGLVPRLVHRLDQRRERAVAAPARHLRRGPGRDTCRSPRTPRRPGSCSRRCSRCCRRGAEHLADRLEADAADRGELVGRQRRTPGAAAPDFRHPGLGHGRQFIAHATSLIEPASAMASLNPSRPIPRFCRCTVSSARAGRFPGRKRTEPVLARGRDRRHPPRCES